MKKVMSFILSVIMFTAMLCPASNAEVEDFTDVDSGAWYAQAVDFVSTPQEGLFDSPLFGGTTPTTFSPQLSMTRGMFVTVLARFMGIETELYTGNKFLDVGDEYYSGPVYWAYSKNIVNGTSEETFSPNMNITREQMCAMLANFMNSIYDYGIKESKLISEYDEFKDDALIHDWAKAQVYYMVSGQIVSGKGDLMFDPLGTATRAEVAKIMQNFCESSFRKTRFDETIIELPGFSGEYTIMQINDSHMTVCDEEDDEALTQAETQRDHDFSLTDYVDGINGSQRLEYLLQLAERMGTDRVILAGDIVDMPTHGNIARLDSLLEQYNNVPCNFILGNHDWCTDVHIMDTYAINNYIPLFNHYYEDSFSDYEVIENEDFIIYTINNSNAQVTVPQLNELKALQEKGKPIFIFSHVPYYDMWIAMMSLAHGWTKAVLMGQTVGDDIPNETTLAFMAEVESENTNVMGYFGGHVHFGADYKIGNGIYAATTDTALSGACRIITIKGTD